MAMFKKTTKTGNRKKRGKHLTRHTETANQTIRQSDSATTEPLPRQRKLDIIPDINKAKMAAAYPSHDTGQPMVIDQPPPTRQDIDMIPDSITVEDKNRIPGRVPNTDIMKGAEELMLDMEEVERTAKEHGEKLQAIYRKGPGGGGGDPSDKGIGAVIKIHELETKEHQYGQKQLTSRQREMEIDRQLNILGLALAEQGCQMVEAKRETYLERKGLGQRAVVLIPCKCESERCDKISRYCTAGTVDTLIREEPRDYQSQDQMKRQRKVNQLKRNKEKGVAVDEDFMHRIEPQIWKEPKCPIIMHAMIAGDVYSFDSYSCASRLNAGERLADTNPIYLEQSKKLRRDTLIKLARKMYKEAERGNSKGTEDGLRECLYERWQAHDENFNWEKVQQEWKRPNTDAAAVRHIQGFMFSDYNEETRTRKIVTKKTDGPENIHKLRHIAKALDTCERQCPEIKYVRAAPGNEVKWFIYSIEMGLTPRGDSDRQEDRREEQRKNSKSHDDSYRIDMEDSPELEKLRLIREAVEKRIEREGDPALVHLMDKEHWRKAGPYSDEENRWIETFAKPKKRTVTSYGELITGMHLENLDDIPIMGIKSEADETITIVSTMGKSVGLIVTILVGFIPKEIQNMLATEGIVKTRDWKLTDTLVKHHLRGPLVDLNIVAIELDDHIHSEEPQLLTDIEGLAAKCMNLDLSLITRGSWRNVKYTKWEQLLTPKLRASDAKITYTILHVYINMRSALNLLVASLELYKAEQLRTKSLLRIMKEQWGYSGDRVFKPTAQNMKELTKGIPRDSLERNRTEVLTKKSRRHVEDGEHDDDLLDELQDLRKAKEEATILYILKRLKMLRVRPGNEFNRYRSVTEIREKMQTIDLNSKQEENINKQLAILEDIRALDTEEHITAAIDLCERCVKVGIKRRRLTDEELEEERSYKRCKELMESEDIDTRQKAQKLLPSTEDLIMMRKELEKKRTEVETLERQRQEFEEIQEVHLKGLEANLNTEEKLDTNWKPNELEEQIKKKKELKQDVLAIGEQTPKMEITFKETEKKKLMEERRKRRQARLEKEARQRRIAEEQDRMDEESIGNLGNRTLEEAETAESQYESSVSEQSFRNTSTNWAEEVEEREDDDSFATGTSKRYSAKRNNRRKVFKD